MPPFSLQRRLFVLLILLLGSNLHAQEPASDEPLPPGAIARLGTTRLVHLGGLSSVAVSPDGKVVASGVETRKILPDVDSDFEKPAPGSLQLWDTKNGKLIREIETPDAPVSSLRFAANGRILYAGCGRYFCALERESGKKLWQQDSIGEIVAERILCTNDRILTVHTGDIRCTIQTKRGQERRDCTQLYVRSWDAKTGKPLTLPAVLQSSTAGGTRIQRLFHDVALSPDGRVAAVILSQAEPTDLNSISWNYTGQRLLFMDVSSGRVISAIKHDGHRIFHPTFSADGRLLACTWDREVSIIKVADGQLRTIQEELLPSYVTDLAFLPNKRVAAKLLDDSVHVWDITNDKSIDSHGVRGDHFLAAGDGKIKAELFGDTIRILDSGSGKPIHSFESHRRPSLVRYAMHSKNTLVSRDRDQAILWDTRIWKAKERFATSSIRDLSRFDGGREELDSSESIERQIRAAVNDDGRLELRNTKTGKLILRLEDGLAPSGSVYFSPAGNRFFFTGDKSVHFFDSATGKELSSIPKIYSGVISPYGKLFAHSPQSEIIKVFNVRSGKQIHELELKLCAKSAGGYLEVCEPGFSNDEQTMFAEYHEIHSAEGWRTGTIEVALWDISKGQLLRTLITKVVREEIFPLMIGGGRSKVPNNLQGLTLSPDRRLFALAPLNSSVVEIWDVASGMKRGEFKGHTGNIADIAFSPDGKQLASSSEDTTILIWDLQRPLQPAKLKDRLNENELAAHLKTLFQPDAAKADVAIWSLIHAAKDSVPFLKTRLRPADRTDAKHVDRLLAALDSGDFRARSKAESELEGLGDLVLLDLEAGLKQNNTVEKRRRLEGLLEKARKAAEPFGSNERIGQWRILEVLEKIGTPDAAQVVRDVASGTPGAQLTLAAQMVLTRMSAKGSH